MYFIKEEDIWVFAECAECGTIMRFRKNQLQLESQSKAYVLEQKIECFCGEQSDIISGIPDKNESLATHIEPSSTKRNVPSCPTCGSENIKKISVGAKVAGGAMFGIFSSNVRKSYKCNNCGYRW